jgi:hypothetical protein
MAGLYPDVKNFKLATDKDGCKMFSLNHSGAVTACSSTLINNMTMASNQYPQSAAQVTPDAGGGGRSGKVAWVFPEKRDISHVMIVTNKIQDVTRTAPGLLQTSLDTTNGLDGTWTTVATYTPPVVAVPDYRTTLRASAALGVKGVRIMDDGVGSFGMSLTTFHVYGVTTAGGNPHRLAFWHPTLDQELAATAFDWGDVPRSSTSTRTFRVKNLSPTLTANTTRVAMSVLQDASPSLVTQHALSDDNATWLSQLALGNVAPGAISGVKYLKRTTLSNAQGGLYNMRIFAEATTWSEEGLTDGR